MLEKNDIAMKGLFKVILVRAQAEERYSDSFHLLREYINNHTQNVDRNRDYKVILMRFQTEIKTYYLTMDERYSSS